MDAMSQRRVPLLVLGNGGKQATQAGVGRARSLVGCDDRCIRLVGAAFFGVLHEHGLQRSQLEPRWCAKLRKAWLGPERRSQLLRLASEQACVTSLVVGGSQRLVDQELRCCMRS